jgi:hypothetical protein
MRDWTPSINGSARWRGLLLSTLGLLGLVVLAGRPSSRGYSRRYDMGARRYSRVPWLNDSDLTPYGQPETTVEHGFTISHGLLVKQPFGPGTDTILTICANRGGRITATESVGAELPIEPAQSNPRRHEDDGA